MTDKVQKIREEIEKRLKGERFLSSDKEYNYLLSFIDSLQEEPVSEGFEKTAEDYGMTDKEKIREKVVKIINSINPFIPDEDGKNSDYEAGKLDATTQILQIIDSMQEEPVSEDLGEYINELSKQFQEVSFAKLSRIAVRVAKWQKEQDQSTIELAEDHAMLAGMEKMKEQMMKDAIELEVKKDAGGYPYIDCIELYDYDKDVPLAKKGDKYKVILIKEE